MNKDSSKIILMANDKPGLAVAEFLRKSGENILRLYLHEPEMQKFGQEIITASGCKKDQIYLAKYLKEDNHLNEFIDLKPDYIITVYWAWILKKDILDSVIKGTINFHPALLPINRGWYPHVHSIIDESPLGVTLHKMDDTADTGPIWAQKEVQLQPYDTADKIYHRLQDEIVKLFIETWQKIKSNQLVPKPQDESIAVYHKKSDVGIMDQLELNKEMKVKDLINLLRARSFGNKGFAYYKLGDKKVHINLRLSDSPNFD